jgi:hypothetical protein
MAHSAICGSSNADRRKACTKSLEMERQMPPKAENQFMARGTLLHSAIEAILNGKPDVIGMTYGGQELTRELFDEKIEVALSKLDELDPDEAMEYETEVEVSFGDALPGVFGTGDFFARLPDRAIVLDWKFGDGVAVSAEGNEQLYFNAAAAMRTERTKWVFEGHETVEFVIVQPPSMTRWTTTVADIKKWEAEFVAAGRLWGTDKATFVAGDHCVWCSAKAICPKMTGAMDRALSTQLDNLPAEKINAYLKNADLLEKFIADLRELAHTMLENGKQLPDWKLVAKRATRKWANETEAKAALVGLGLAESEVTETSLLSPAQVEKVLKKRKIALPEDQIVAVSSGTTLARRDDPRPEVLDVGRQMANVLKLQ